MADRLIEHLNTEFSLRTIKTIEEAINWVNGTFYAVRMAKNPEKYNCISEISSYIESVCESHIKSLSSYDLIIAKKNGTYQSTKLGRTVANFCVSIETVINSQKTLFYDTPLNEVLM
jgi:replicative superfamily II helicase